MMMVSSKWIVAKDGSLIAVRHIEHITLVNFEIRCECVSGKTYVIGRYKSTDDAKQAFEGLCYIIQNERTI